MLYFKIVNNKYKKIKKSGYIWTTSKEENQLKFKKKNGDKMAKLKIDTKNEKEELSRIEQFFREQVKLQILNDITQQKLLKNQEFFISTIKSNLYTLTCTQNPSSSTTKISFTPLTSQSEIDLINSRVSSKFGLSEPKTK